MACTELERIGSPRGWRPCAGSAIWKRGANGRAYGFSWAQRSNATAPSPPAWRGNGRRSGDGDDTAAVPHHGRLETAPGPRRSPRTASSGAGSPCPAETSNRPARSTPYAFTTWAAMKSESDCDMRNSAVANTARFAAAVFQALAPLPCRRRRCRPGNRNRPPEGRPRRAAQ